MKTPIKILSILALLGVASFAAYKLIKGRKNNANNSVDDTADNSLELPTPPVITPTITATSTPVTPAKTYSEPDPEPEPEPEPTKYLSLYPQNKVLNYYRSGKKSDLSFSRIPENELEFVGVDPWKYNFKTLFNAIDYGEKWWNRVGANIKVYHRIGHSGDASLYFDFVPGSKPTTSTTTTTTTTTAKSTTPNSSTTAKDKALAEIARLQKQMTVENANDNDVINLIPLSDYIATWISPSSATVSKKSAYPSTYRKNNYTFITSNPNSYTNWNAFGISNIPGYFDVGDSIWALSENPVGIANFFVAKSTDNTQKQISNAAASITTFSAYNLFDWFNKKNGGSVAPSPKLEKITSADVDDMGSSPNAIKWSNYNITDYPLAAWVAWDKTGKGFHFYAKKTNNKGTKNWYIVTEN